MFKHVDDIDSKDYDVFDLTINKRIPFVQWADDKTNTYEVLETDGKGEIKYCSKCGEVKRIIVSEKNIKIVKKE